MGLIDNILHGMAKEAAEAGRRVLEACAADDFDERKIAALGRNYRAKAWRFRDARLAQRVIEQEGS